MAALSLKRWLVGFVVSATLTGPAGGQTARKQSAPEHWVSTWATALQLMPAAPRRPPAAGGAPAPAGASGAAGPPNAAPGVSIPAAPVAPGLPPVRTPGSPAPIGPPPHNLPDTFEDQTL